MKNGGMFGFPSPARKKNRSRCKKTHTVTTAEDASNMGYLFTRQDVWYYNDNSNPVSKAYSAPSEFCSTQVFPAPSKLWSYGQTTYYPLFENGGTNPPTGIGWIFGKPITPWQMVMDAFYGDFSGTPAELTVMYSHNGRDWYNVAGKCKRYRITAGGGNYAYLFPRLGVKAKYWGFHTTLQYANAVDYYGQERERYVNVLDGADKDFIDELKSIELQDRHVFMANRYLRIGGNVRVNSTARKIMMLSSSIQYTGSIFTEYSYRAMKNFRQLAGYNSATAVFNKTVAGMTDSGFLVPISTDQTYPDDLRLMIEAPNDEYRIIPQGPNYKNMEFEHNLGEVPSVYMFMTGPTQYYIVHPEFLDGGTTPGLFDFGVMADQTYYNQPYSWDYYKVTVNTITEKKAVFTKSPSTSQPGYQGCVVVFRDDPESIVWGSYTGTGVARTITITTDFDIGFFWIGRISEIDGEIQSYEFMLIDRQWYTGLCELRGGDVYFSGGGYNQSGATYYYIATRYW